MERFHNGRFKIQLRQLGTKYNKKPAQKYTRGLLLQVIDNHNSVSLREYRNIREKKTEKN